MVISKESKLHTVSKTEELLHEYSQKLPMDNCLNVRGKGKNKLGE